MEAQQSQPGLSLLFAIGERPSTQEIDRLLSSPELAGPQAIVTHRPRTDEGWLELLANGLSFDIAGLLPAPAATMPEGTAFYGLPAEIQTNALESVTLRPGPHLAGGAAMIPVVRAMASLAVNLALHLPAKAVCWHPARSWMDPNYFARIMVGWLAGGSFPALGLTAIEHVAAGAVRSNGLAFFTGQEMLLDGRSGEARADTVRIAARVIDHLVRGGPITSLQELQGPSGERLFAEPSDDERLLRVWRGR